MTAPSRRCVVWLGAMVLLAAGCSANTPPTVTAASPPGAISYLASSVSSGSDSLGLTATVLADAGSEHRLDPVYDGSSFGEVVLAPSGRFAAVLGGPQPDSPPGLRILRFETGRYIDVERLRGCDVAGTVLIAPNSESLLHAACDHLRGFAWRNGAWQPTGTLTSWPDSTPLAVSDTGLLLSVEGKELIVRSTPAGTRLHAVRGLGQSRREDLSSAAAVFASGDTAFVVTQKAVHVIDARAGTVTRSATYSTPAEYSDVFPTMVGAGPDSAAWSVAANGRLQIWRATADTGPQRVFSTKSDALDVQVASSVMRQGLEGSKLTDITSR